MPGDPAGTSSVRGWFGCYQVVWLDGGYANEENKRLGRRRNSSFESRKVILPLYCTSCTHTVNCEVASSGLNYKPPLACKYGGREYGGGGMNPWYGIGSLQYNMTEDLWGGGGTTIGTGWGLPVSLLLSQDRRELRWLRFSDIERFWAKDSNRSPPVVGDSFKRDIL